MTVCRRQRAGFTLLEAMLVLGIIGVLTVSSLTWLRPTAHMQRAHNTQRTADVQTLLNGIHQYAVDHRGNFPVCIDTSVRNICAGPDCTGVPNECNLYPIVGKYLVGIPVDPSGTKGNDSQYDVQLSPKGRVTVSAPEADGDEEIFATR